MTAMQWILLVVGVLLSAMGGGFLKAGAVQIQYDGGLADILFQALINWRIIAGVLMYLIPVMIWIFLLKKVELSFLQPLFAMVYVVTPILASLFLNEDVTFMRWTGIAVIVIGVIIVARS
jgi:drug/metabolite transporter (DMT)-like permease